MLADFQAILNRDDCSTAQANVFMQQGMQRIQRDCRIPSMERQQIINVGSSGTPMVLLPADIVALQDIIWTPGPASLCSTPRALKKTSYRDLLCKQQLSFPEWYARVQGQYWIAGRAAEGDTLQILYWGNFSDFPTGDDDNELSASTPDFAVYAALSFAADNFEHPLAAQWESRYQAIKAEVQMMADSLEAEGGPQSIQSPYRWE
jgi:NAD(P)-dependent dehydrogenase (short-subunit alcohol dehydrogenase family)